MHNRSPSMDSWTYDENGEISVSETLSFEDLHGQHANQLFHHMGTTITSPPSEQQQDDGISFSEIANMAMFAKKFKSRFRGVITGMP